MCRSIKKLRGDAPATEAEVREAALQFVRKISGYRVPSRVNEGIFNQAVVEIEVASRKMLDSLGSPRPSSVSAK